MELKSHFKAACAIIAKKVTSFWLSCRIGCSFFVES